MKYTALCASSFLLAAFSCGAITVQNADSPMTLRGNDGTLVVNSAQPKYSLNEAVAVCIRELEQRGEKVTANAVKNRLERMPKSDVDLNASGLSRTVRELVEAYDAEKSKDLPAPDPKKYDRREKFVAAYADWKTKTLTPAQRRELHSRMGAESKFRREAKEEAASVWQNRSAESKKNSAAEVSQDNASEKPQVNESENGKETK